MTYRDRVNEYFNGRPFAVLCGAVLVAVAWVAYSLGAAPAGEGSGGFVFNLQRPLIANGLVSMAVNVASLLMVGALMLLLNKIFNFVRAVTSLPMAVFCLLQMAYPQSLTSFGAGSLLCLLFAFMLLLLFDSYQDKGVQGRIYMTFAIVSAGTMFRCAYALLIPVLLLGYLYLRALNFRGVVAMVLGLVTPWWIALGLGLVSYTDLMLPQVEPIWLRVTRQPADLLMALATATAVLGLVLVVMNLLRLLNYRLQTRVYNTFFVVTLVLTVVAMGLDCRDLTSLLPLLNLTVAVQVAHAYTLSHFQYRYVFMLLLIAGCVASAVCNLMA